MEATGRRAGFGENLIAHTARDALDLFAPAERRGGVYAHLPAGIEIDKPTWAERRTRC